MAEQVKALLDGEQRYLSRNVLVQSVREVLGVEPSIEGLKLFTLPVSEITAEQMEEFRKRGIGVRIYS